MRIRIRIRAVEVRLHGDSHLTIHLEGRRPHNICLQYQYHYHKITSDRIRQAYYYYYHCHDYHNIRQGYYDISEKKKKKERKKKEREEKELL